MDYARIRKVLQEHWAIALILAVYIASQIAVLTLVWGDPLIWDGAVYAGMGKHLYSLGEIGYWEMFRPVMIPLMIGFLWFLGFPVLYTAPVFAVTLSVAVIAGVYLLASDLFDRETAVYSAGVVASTFVLFFHASQLLTGITASGLVFLAAYLCYRERYIPAGVITAAAFLTRLPAALTGPALVLFIAYRYRNDVRSGLRRLVYYGAGNLILLIPYAAINYVSYGSPLAPITAGFQIPLGNPAKYFYGMWFFVEMVKNNPLLVFVPFGIAAVLYRRELRYGAFLAVLGIIYGFHTYYHHKLARFIILFLPLAAVFAARGLEEVKQFQEFIPDNTFKGLALGLILAAIVFSASTSYETYSWENPEKTEYLNQFKEIEADTVAGNGPHIAVYGDYRYIHIALEWSPIETYERFRDELDYVGIDECGWYRMDEERQEKAEELRNLLQEENEVVFSQETEQCRRFIVKVT